jgi:hypothetical protein
MKSRTVTEGEHCLDCLEVFVHYTLYSTLFFLACVVVVGFLALVLGLAPLPR